MPATAASAAPTGASIRAAVQQFTAAALAGGGDDGDGGGFNRGALEDQALSNVDPREAARRLTDPISAVDIAATACDALRHAAAEQPQLLQAAGAEVLTPTQVQALQRIFQQQQ